MFRQLSILISKCNRHFSSYLTKTRANTRCDNGKSDYARYKAIPLLDNFVKKQKYKIIEPWQSTHSNGYVNEEPPKPMFLKTNLCQF